MNGNEPPEGAAPGEASGGDPPTANGADLVRLEVARLRGVAALASTLMHDLNNHLNSCLALAMVARPQLQDPVDITLHDDLCRGVQQGAGLARAMVGLLQRLPRLPREVVPAVQLLDGALAAITKVAQQREVQLQVVRAPELPRVRTVVAEATSALLLTFSALVAAKPSRLEVIGDEAVLSLAGGRPRRCARVRVLAVGINPHAAAEIAVALAGAGSLGVRAGLDRGGLLQAAIAQRVLGGDLVAVSHRDGIELVLGWPASG
ncbi:MAG: hypothetical protein MUC36_14135 [Planctomycetes bacterium]|nr:hypothetical protein [Planctomycetota bacterium]